MSGNAETLAVRALLRRPNLTAERERQLLIARRTSDDEGERQQALAELWESHSKLVVAIARQYQRPGLAMTDLLGAGHLGMHAAIEAFDPDRFEFATRHICCLLDPALRSGPYRAPCIPGTPAGFCCASPAFPGDRPAFCGRAQRLSARGHHA